MNAAQIGLPKYQHFIPHFFLAAETRGWVWHTREVDLPQGAVALQGIGQVAGPLTADAVGCMEADGSYAARCVTAEQWLH